MARPFRAPLLVLLLGACGPAPVVELDAAVIDAAAVDAVSGPDAGSCAPGEFADWYCVQGEPETHICTDSMWPPRCVDGRWACGGAQPDWYVDCWCHLGPPDGTGDRSLCACTEADGWTCAFHCGPSLLCTAYEEYCARTPSDVGGEPDSFACRAFDACGGTPGCDCIAEGSVSCEMVENHGTVATYPGG